MYLIVKGSVKITEKVLNPVTLLMEDIDRCILTEKKAFGESAVMFNTRRMNSVQTLSKYHKILFLKIHLSLLDSV